MHANIKETLQHEFVSKPALMLLGASKRLFSNKERVFHEGISALIFVSTTLYVRQLSTHRMHTTPNLSSKEN